MVSRKPLPPNATFDPAVPSHARSPEPKPEAQQEFVLPPFESTGGFWDDTSNNINQNQNTDAAQDMSNSHQPGQAAGNYAGLEEENVWANNNSSSNLDRVLTVLRPGSSHRMDNTGSLGKVAERTDAGLDVTRVPTILRPAGGPSSRETNPFKRKMHNQDGSANPASTSSTTPLPESLTGAFSDLAVGDTTKNPWQPALSDNSALGQRPSYQLPEPSPGMEDGWKGSEPPRPSTSTPPRLLSLPSEEGSAGWENERDKPPNIQLGFTAEEDEVLGDSHAWDDLSTVNKGNGTAAVPAVPDKGGSDDEWNLIDVDPPRSSQPNVQQSPSNSKPSPPRRRDTWEDFDEEKDTPQPSTSQQVAAPLTKDQPPPQGKAPELPARTELPPRTELPRRTSSEQPPPQPPRPVDKNETYHIKNINWFDITAAKNPRSTPILVQNANGPCPLVALVNALTLTTPADKNTALVDTLKTREQVSLGLLLDAVFDELMSERRLDPNVPLPDITQLYSFLQGLHTGMNVNPRFIPTESILQSFKRTSLTHIHPSQRGEMSIPGTFEHTKEMTLYSTFSIPLIHGWLPRPDDIVYQSFARQAASYEDVQNLLFREEELDDKLSSSHHHEGLTEEEQQLYQDILSIKSFLHSSATQLTNFGLEVIKKSMKPGSVAILFRNDHFATLYRHPQTLELLTLVTDAGYAGHAEVVWESLVDTTGEKAEFFSGDFRVVGGASHTSSTPAARTQGSGSWADVASSSGNRRSREQGRGGRSSSSEAPTSPTTEQEDRDFAMALQLQEEEDNRHRQEEDRRRREARLSEQYIEQQGRAAQAHNSRGGAGSGRGGSHAASRSTGSLGSSGTANTGRRAPSGICVTSSTPTVASSNNSATPNRPRPSTQTVRSLIPPVQPAAAANRDPEAGLDDAPPSYEQASQQAAYEPPTGHPAHPASSPTAATSQPASTLGATQRPSTGASQPSPRVHNAPRTGGSAGGRAPNGSHGYPGAGGAGPGRQGLRQGVPVVPANGRSGVGEEREKCVVM
ncbi:uncharacterized protein PODANS_3_5720 [Podospora anserina S mat+]|uniref:Podospora anserina S mat+ genomic DNA chromosome 3, supercontig 2 n=1 Tax=Podospora anserina (strain S / ATCC MYA-4624 / DSM 980 / FGSC 10383) TaxID=515849 RepID=B2B0J7_PODAN|nr:uncharacterized protein PODANS_3_5720 [Podospora anserina S mat+]CAP70503.1 unnamed protein product [Podospora anserina S mat+]CDP27092.1 Putative protein of unknown function [Podospora anserina S mat+]